MTAAFDKFMGEHGRSGSEKADGYSEESFFGLTDAEAETVFGMLESELPFSTRWLFRLDAPRALKVVQEEEKRTRGDKYTSVFILQEYLIQHSGDLVYQDHMIEDYPAYGEDLKPLVVDAIGRTPVTPNYIEFLRKVVLTETNSSAKSRAARRLLTAVQVLRRSDAEPN